MIFSACTPNMGTSGLRGKTSQTLTGANLSLGQGFVLADNPVVLAGNLNLDPNTDLNTLVAGAYITNKGFLTGAAPCDGLLPCFEVLSTRTSLSALQTTDGKWAYNVTTPEFLQTNTFYHLNKSIDLFYNNLAASRTFSTRPGYDSAIPTLLTFRTEPLHTYANCEVADNANFDYAKFTLCFGYLSGNTNMKFAQDSTIIYHEAGHFFQKLQLNFRNDVPSTVAPQADMGTVFYTEAGSIGEGLSDFYSYYVNGRAHLGEWAAGRILRASRPISESESMHAPGISTDPSQRLNYPQFLNYDPNNPMTPVEDIHYAGMIISHYLVALSQDFQSYCLMPKQAANNMITHLLNETLAELGDLTTKGTNLGTAGKINYKNSGTLAKDWYRVINPINYRSFTQTFAKNLYQNMQSIPACNGAFYGKDRIETLLDDYGLLLFRTYNQNRNYATVGDNTVSVAATNRKKSSLISKTLLKLDPTPGASSAFIIDAQNQIADGVAQLGAAGAILTDHSFISGFPFNNGNSRVSPGEVVAIGLNLYNDSNATMGGIQVLANDWNHVDPVSGKPYIFDQWPLVSEGGTAAPATVAEQFSPVCLIQGRSADGSSTQWITQNAYRQKVAVDKTMCLDSSNTGTSDKDCFIRAVKGVEQAQYSKLAPKSNWGKTLTDPQTQAAYGIGWSNVILFQVSKHVPPGTIVNCRLRARFTNCEECYHDANRSNYDYKDLDYNGAAPFKIINLQFSIID